MTRIHYPPKYIEDGFTTNKNIHGYFITGKGLKRIKDVAKIAGLSWQAIASRPKSARELVERIEKDATHNVQN